MKRVLPFQYKQNESSVRTSFEEVSRDIYDGQITSTIEIITESTYGHTLGNALRRALLTSVSGFAPVAISLPGITNEFEVVKGMLETVLDLVLKIKKLSVRTNDTTILHLETSESGDVFASQFVTEEGVEIMNPNLKLCTFETTPGNSKFKLEVIIAKGQGYVQSRFHSFSPEIPMGFFTIDSLFSPVLNCTFVVEPLSAGNVEKDKVILTFVVDAKIDPLYAFHLAASSIVKNILPLVGDDQEDLVKSIKEEGEKANIDHLLERTIESFSPDEMPPRARNSLKRHEINTIEQLLTKTPAELLTLGGIGEKALQEIIDFLFKYGLQLGINPNRLKRRKF